MKEINIKDLLNYLKKYVFIIVLVAAFFLIEVIIYDKNIKTPMYSSSTTLVLTQANENTNINTTITQNDININQKLVKTYSQIIKSKLVLQQVIDNLKLDYSVGELSNKISVQSVQDTEILRISVKDEDKKKTAIIANEVAEVFSKEVAQIYQLNNISIIDKAIVPTGVCNNTLKRDMVLAVFVAVALTVGILFVIYYFDDSVKLTENLEEEIGMPVVAKIIKSDIKNKGKAPKEELLIEKNPKSVVSESIKELRTNLQFSSVDNEMKTILVTSSLPGEGKSFISANLAVAFAQLGKRVLLVDCDMRKGRQHKMFKVPNLSGLSDLLIDDVKEMNGYIIKGEFGKMKIDKLSLITRGTVPPNPSELLNSRKNKLLIKLLKEKYDFVIFDGAPCNGLTDSIIMSTLVDQVLIVTSEGKTPKDILEETRKSLENVNAPITGIVLNKINKKSSAYGRYYSYYESNK